MLIYLLRHGLTEYNAEKRYQGQRDIPLSAAGRAMLCRADISPKTVYITPLCRTRQTAEVLFPGARLVETDGLKEMCFGSFEGRNYIEMEHDPDYLAWVAANCESPCPDGETKAAFCERICAAFSALVDKALADGEEMLVILAHGGTQMAAMERYALPHKDYCRRSYFPAQVPLPPVPARTRTSVLPAPESTCAGALNVQLAGPAYYFGEYYKKPTIGDAVRPIEAGK